ncbi:MAG: hypothetical protein C4526_12330 [Nitrospiraceae bacterium]|nr:MAG: hypothetical protein C4526_12330 [Nitrospiraceae bacterium]
MDKYFIDRKGRAEEIYRDTGEKRPVHFPLCLAIKYGEEVPVSCPDFFLNTDSGRVFVETDSPLPEGSDVMLHFYIPPETKLLLEFKGRVIPRRGGVPGAKGNLIKIRDITRRRLRKLEEYLEEKRHLVDREA